MRCKTNVKKLLGQNIQKYRQKRNLSQAQLAEMSDTSVTHISDIENGNSFVSSELLEALASVLGVSFASLFRNDDDRSDCIEAMTVIDRELLKAASVIKNEIANL